MLTIYVKQKTKIVFYLREWVAKKHILESTDFIVAVEKCSVSRDVDNICEKKRK